MAMDAESFRSTVRQTAREGEDEDAILSGVQLLADERAKRLGRASTPEDVEYFLSMFCWNPLKPDPPEHVQADLRHIRREAFGTPRTDVPRQQWLASFVDDDAFAWAPSELYEAQQEGTKRFLRFQTEPSA